MKKLFIVGHSDSGDAYLPEGVLPWPERTRDWLSQQTGERWELVDVRFAPMGARAVDYLMGKVEAAAPDLLILPFSAYVCTVGSVEESIRAPSAIGPRAGSDPWSGRSNGRPPRAGRSGGKPTGGAVRAAA